MWFILQTYFKFAIPYGVPQSKCPNGDRPDRVSPIAGRPRKSEPSLTEEQTNIDP